MKKAFAAFAAAALIDSSYANDKFAEGSESRELMKLHGHVSAVFTPVNENGDLDIEKIPLLAARLQEWGVVNVMVGGTTGESLSFSYEERMECVKAWLKFAPQYDINVYVHAGMDDVQLASKYVSQLTQMDGVKGIFAMPPVYFKPKSIDNLVDTMALIASGAPDLPFWYYHFPAMTGVDFNMFQFTEAIDASGKIPNYMGVKFTNEILMDFNSIGHYKNGKYNMLFGRDEILTSALATGVCDGDVSSTVNFLTFNLNATNAWNNGDLQTAQDLQMKTVEVIETWVQLMGDLNTQKAILKMTGIDFGPLRLPQENMTKDQEIELGTALYKLGVNITDEYIKPEALLPKAIPFEDAPVFLQ